MSKEITATLENWFVDPIFRVIWGDIQDDVRHRWRNGTRIHTSSIPDFGKKKFRRGMVVQTLNSHYKLGKPAAK